MSACSHITLYQNCTGRIFTRFKVSNSIQATNLYYKNIALVYTAILCVRLSIIKTPVSTFHISSLVFFTIKIGLKSNPELLLLVVYKNVQLQTSNRK